MLTNDLIAYIENEVKRGVSHEAISEALVAAGWKALEVADALRVVTERMHGGTSGMPYVAPVATSIPQKESINQEAVQNVLRDPSKESAVHTPPSQPINPSGDPAHSILQSVPVGGLMPGSGAESVFQEVKITENRTKDAAKKPEHHKLLPILVVFGLLILGGAAYFFLSPILNDPSKKIAELSAQTEVAKSIQYSGEYDISAPAGLLLSDKVLISTFGGIGGRQTTSTMKGAYMGVDDWFDFRSKKNEVKFVTKITVPGNNPVDFTSTSRLISNALYVKLSESSAIFDSSVANQGANWVRFDEGSEVPMFAYGFFGGASLYNQGFSRMLSQYISAAVPTGSVEQPTGDTIVTVSYPDALVNYFTSIFITGDKLGITGSIGPKYPAMSYTEPPTGEVTIGLDGKVKKATFVFGYKVKEYTVPVRVRFSLSYDRFDLPPTINIPSLVVPFADLSKKDAAVDLPEGLQGFFSDVRTIASVYKGINQSSYKGVCIKKGEETENNTELTIPFISSKVLASGYQLPVCTDADTAWSYVVRDGSGNYYCTDSRGFSGKAARQPLGDKCN